MPARHLVNAYGDMADGLNAGAAVDGLAGPQDDPGLAAALHGRGWSGDDVTALLGGNLVRVLRAVLP